MTSRNSIASYDQLLESGSINHLVHPPETYNKEAFSPNNSSDGVHDNSHPPQSEDHNVEKRESLYNVASARSSLSRKSHTVPRLKRRGVLSHVTLIPELDDARNYSNKVKFVIVVIVAFAAVTGPMGTSILLPAVDDVSKDLGTTATIVNVSVGIYLISLGVFPMWWSNFSERHGRRSVYVVSFTWFFAFSIGSALAPNIAGLIVLRLLAGVGASSVQACGAATVADLYVPEERGYALGLFYLGPLLGPFISPVIGGAVAQAWGWRATQWVMVIFCGVNVVSVLFLLPETLRVEDSLAQVKKRLQEQLLAHETEGEQPPTENELTRWATDLSRNSSLRRQVLNDEPAVDPIMPSISRLSSHRSALTQKMIEQELNDAEKKSNTVHSNSWSHHAYEYFIRPMHSVVLLGYPPVILTISYSSICFCGIYFFNIAITDLYSKKPYNFNSVIVGLMYIPNSVTYLLASIYGGKWNDWLYKRHARLHNGESMPEARISWNAVTAVILYPPACLIFGWCLNYGEHWVTPLIGSALFGFASMLIIGITVTYLIDVLPGKGATVVALNNLIRMILAAVATFITEPLITALGTGVLFSIITGVITVFSVFLLCVKRYGPSLREKYDISDYYARL